MNFFRAKNQAFILVAVFLFCAVTLTAYAQVDPGVYSFGVGKGEPIKIVPRNDNEDEVNSYHENKISKKKEYIYEEMTMETLSHLYWAVSLLDIENDEYIDNFMKINECEIYRNYYGSDFEWKEIRNAGRDFLRKNKDQFPLRFRIVQPLKLVDYDMKRRAFYINPEFQIMSVRRFEAYAIDAFEGKICDDNASKELEGYAKGLVLELSRPFSLTYVPAKPKDASEYIEEKEELLRDLPVVSQNNFNRYRFRTAFLVLKVKIFAHRKSIRNGRYMLTQMMAALEGFEIYADRDLKKALYIKNYIDNQNEAQTSEELQKEYEILYEKAQGEGVLY